MNKKGRPRVPKSAKMKVITISLPYALLYRVDECREKQGKTRSEFIRGMLEMQLFTQKGYIAYQIQQKRLELKMLELELEKATNKCALIEDSQEVLI